MNEFEELFNGAIDSNGENNQGDSVPDDQSTADWAQAFDYSQVPTQKETWQKLREREENERVAQPEMEQFKNDFMEGIRKKATHEGY